MRGFLEGAVGLVAVLVGSACLITFVVMVLSDLIGRRK
jgi:hypothetical protein